MPASGPAARPRKSALPIVLTQSQKLALGLIAAVWLATMFGGGSARHDVLYLVVVRVAAVAGIALLLLLIPRGELRLQRQPLAFAGIAAAAVLVQLVPLPPAIWTALPGRELYQTLGPLADLEGLWRPISLSPDLSWNALLSFGPPLFFLLAIPTIHRGMRRWLLMALLATIIISGIIGLLQVAGGPSSPLRHYQYTNVEAATGLFSNRNHQAVFLAMGIPLALWWGLPEGTTQRRSRLVIAASIIMFLLTAAVTTQSRMGAAIVLLSMVLGAVYYFRQTSHRAGAGWWGAAGAGLAVILALVAFGTWSGSRLAIEAATADLRVRILPESIEAAQTFFPVGAGFGTVANVFPRFESFEDLGTNYINHTHSELTQLVIEGGILAILLLLIFLAWFVLAVRRSSVQGRIRFLFDR